MKNLVIKLYFLHISLPYIRHVSKDSLIILPWASYLPVVKQSISQRQRPVAGVQNMFRRQRLYEDIYILLKFTLSQAHAM